MRTASLLLLLSLCACERTPAGAPVPRPSPAPAPAPAPPPLPAVAVAATPRTAEPPPVTPPAPAHAVHLGRPAAHARRDTAAPLPVPPSVEPRAYATWLDRLPRAQQRRIARFCRAHPTSYAEVCGGIGPLHIPYPPYPRAAAVAPHRSLFASVADWRGSLSAAQTAYLERACVGGEDRPSSDLCGDNTPLVVSFDDQPVRFVTGGRFAFQPGEPVATDLPTPATPWIALDRDHDGTIDRGAELFGSDTVLPDGSTADNGFTALAALDDNHDGVIDARDPVFAALVLWSDRDGDGRSSPDELVPLSRTIVSISLAARLEPRCDARHDCEGERAVVTWRDARGALHRGAVIDVYLPRR